MERKDSKQRRGFEKRLNCVQNGVDKKERRERNYTTGITKGQQHRQQQQQHQQGDAKNKDIPVYN